MTRTDTEAVKRVARRGGRACALALAVAAFGLVAVPAGAATTDYPPPPRVPPAGGPVPPPGDPPAPHPDTPPPVTLPAPAPPAPAAPQSAEPRPVAQRPTAGGGDAAGEAALAVRRLGVSARVALTPDRPGRLVVTFVARPGSLIAQVQVSRRRGAARRVLLTRFVGVRSGRRATVRLRLRGMEPGVYEVSVRAGAARTTLGPAVVAKLRID